MRKQTNNYKRLARSLLAIVVVVASAFPLMAIVSGSMVSSQSGFVQGEGTRLVSSTDYISVEDFESYTAGEDIDAKSGPLGVWDATVGAGCYARVYNDGGDRVLDASDQSDSAACSVVLDFDEHIEIDGYNIISWQQCALAGGFNVVLLEGSSIRVVIYFYQDDGLVFANGHGLITDTGLTYGNGWEGYQVLLCSTSQFLLRQFKDGIWSDWLGPFELYDAHWSGTGPVCSAWGLSGSTPGMPRVMFDDVDILLYTLNTEDFESLTPGDVHLQTGPIGTWTARFYGDGQTATVATDGYSQALQIWDSSGTGRSVVDLWFASSGKVGDVISFRHYASSAEIGGTISIYASGVPYIQLAFSYGYTRIFYYDSGGQMRETPEYLTPGSYQTFWIKFDSISQFKFDIGSTEPNWNSISPLQARNTIGDGKIIDILRFQSGTPDTYLQYIDDISLRYWEFTSSPTPYGEDFESLTLGNIDLQVGPIGTWSATLSSGHTAVVAVDGGSQALKFDIGSSTGYSTVQLMLDELGEIGDVISFRHKLSDDSGGEISIWAGGMPYVHLSFAYGDENIRFIDGATQTYDTGEDFVIGMYQTIWIKFHSTTQFKIHVGPTEPIWNLKTPRAIRAQEPIPTGEVIDQLKFYSHLGNVYTQYIDCISASWIVPGEENERSILLSPATPTANYQVPVQLPPSFDYDSCDPQGDDLRFYAPGEIECDYWIESWVLHGTSRIWVEVPTAGTSSLTLTYGDPALVAASNGANTFVFFDDFVGTSIDLSKWATPYQYSTIATVTVAGGIATMIAGTGLTKPCASVVWTGMINPIINQAGTYGLRTDRAVMYSLGRRPGMTPTNAYVTQTSLSTGTATPFTSYNPYDTWTTWETARYYNAGVLTASFTMPDGTVLASTTSTVPSGSIPLSLLARTVQYGPGTNYIAGIKSLTSVCTVSTDVGMTVRARMWSKFDARGTYPCDLAQIQADWILVRLRVAVEPVATVI